MHAVPWNYKWATKGKQTWSSKKTVAWILECKYLFHNKQTYHSLTEVSVVMKSRWEVRRARRCMSTWINPFWLCLIVLSFPFTAIQEQENESVPFSLSPDISLNKSQLHDCPRDSGCYISSENSDNGKEDLESENLSDMVQKITITETSDWTHILNSISTAAFYFNSSWAKSSSKKEKYLQIQPKMF